MLSGSTEAEFIKTLVGLGRPVDAVLSLAFLDESLPDSGVRELAAPDDEDGFSDNEADTRVEFLPAHLDALDELEPLPADWEDEEATRPQLYLPNHPSEPPPSLPGNRLAESNAAAAERLVPHSVVERFGLVSKATLRAEAFIGF